jgi:molybdopterin-guanine dinucleotide biosynthesis protein A
MESRIRHAAVLAGGKSSRMGMDKATVRVGGVMMLEHVVRAAIGAGLEVMVVGRGVPPKGWPEELRVDFFADDGAAYAGPAAGVVKALEVLHAEVVVLGCDLPLISPGAIRSLIAAHEGAGTAATLAMREFAEPAFAVYSPEMLPRLKSIVLGERKGFQWLVGEPDIFAWRGPPEIDQQLLNVNDAETLKRAELALRGNARPLRD